jgi:hypothetical protein
MWLLSEVGSIADLLSNGKAEVWELLDGIKQPWVLILKGGELGSPYCALTSAWDEDWCASPKDSF